MAVPDRSPPSDGEGGDLVRAYPPDVADDVLGLRSGVLAQVALGQAGRQLALRVHLQLGGAPDVDCGIGVGQVVDGQADPRVALQVADLGPVPGAGEQHRVAVADVPDRGRVRAPVPGERGDDGEVLAVEQTAGGVVEGQCHAAVCPAISAQPTAATPRSGLSVKNPSRPAAVKVRISPTRSPTALGSVLLRNWRGRNWFSRRNVQACTIRPWWWASAMTGLGVVRAPDASRGISRSLHAPIPSA